MNQKDILKDTPESLKDHEQLTKAISSLKEVITHIFYPRGCNQCFYYSHYPELSNNSKAKVKDLQAYYADEEALMKHIDIHDQVASCILLVSHKKGEIVNFIAQKFNHNLRKNRNNLNKPPLGLLGTINNMSDNN